MHDFMVLTEQDVDDLLKLGNKGLERTRPADRLLAVNSDWFRDVPENAAMIERLCTMDRAERKADGLHHMSPQERGRGTMYSHGSLLQYNRFGGRPTAPNCYYISGVDFGHPLQLLHPRGEQARYVLFKIKGTIVTTGIGHRTYNPTCYVVAEVDWQAQKITWAHDWEFGHAWRVGMDRLKALVDILNRQAK